MAEESAPFLAPRVALASIAVFWIFYWVIWSARATFLYHAQVPMLIPRLIVSLSSMGVTWIVYRLMRRVPIARLRRSIVAAALLAIPAALLYSSVNYMIFDVWWHPTMMRAMKAPPVQPVAPVLPQPPSGAIAVPAPPAPAASPQVTVGTMDDEPKSPFVAIADNAANGYFFFIGWAALYLALCYAGAARALERDAATLRAAAQAAELKALRYQINPHFLFNTLNSLSSLVLTGKREQAEQMIINLSTFFRSSLTGDPTEDVPLSEEILLQRLYLDIEAVRFPSRLRTEIDVPDALLGVCVPGLILQPLVENAVKYAVARASRPVTVRIAAEERGGALHLAVEDDGEPAKDIEGGTGVGLANVRDRMAARFGAKGICRWEARAGGGFVVRLIMPMTRHGC